MLRLDDASIDRIYKLYRHDPDAGRSSYLHDHYRRGREGIMRPTPEQARALAAWKAGRDAAKAELKS